MEAPARKGNIESDVASRRGTSHSYVNFLWFFDGWIPITSLATVLAYEASAARMCQRRKGRWRWFAGEAPVCIRGERFVRPSGGIAYALPKSRQDHVLPRHERALVCSQTP